MKGAQLKAAGMVQLHSISSINDDIGTLSNWRIAALFKFFERLGKNKATAVTMKFVTAGKPKIL